jgi:transposase
LEDTKQETLQPLVFSNVQRGSTISTDEGNAYRGLGHAGPYRHFTVDHSAEEYVRKVGLEPKMVKHYVNSLEGFWCDFKKGIRGTNVHVSATHMWKYVSEYTHRYNTREAGSLAMFNRLVDAFALPRLTET